MTLGVEVSIGEVQEMDYDHRSQSVVSFDPSLTHNTDEEELFFIVSELGDNEQRKIRRGQTTLRLVGKEV